MMRKEFRGLILLIAVILMMGLTGCGKSKSSASDGQSGEITLKLGHNQPTESQFHAGADKFAELVSEKTDGKVKIDVYHSSQLGDEGELAEGTKLGTVDISLVASGSVTKYYPRFSIFDLPFLFRDSEHVDKVLQGEVGELLAKEAEEQGGFKVMNYWESGFRHFLNSKQSLKSPEDLKGLKIRTPEWPVLISTTEALGANSVPMPFSELYMAAQHGVVDGQEGPVFAIKSSKMYEVQDYMVMDGHTYTSMLLIMNPNKFDGLSKENQEALMEAAKEAGDYERKLIRDNEKKEIDYLETEGGLTIEKNPDKDEWRKAVKSVYEKYSDEFGEDLIQQIINTK
ncbi:TRAP transporter substrate-binding protein [Rossellomorea vietnamensis]|uniref:TRAP transporter substrate-binding protein n=1 Tax=Rossellomorea vietnamensis TaxID=218284 RepID=A0A5D4MIQ8_9BACI|nr:TRAP transporter substrate-binding protein [Rossellomorea vietnamensis]TYS01477.1 TRAP transporter substrate-binding protein [Rossellomorea vietnamensis]